MWQFFVSGLTTAEVLIKDLKVVSGQGFNLAICSIPVHINVSANTAKVPLLKLSLSKDHPD